MIKTVKELITYRELMLTLAWKNIAIRYKQAYLGIVWAVLKPLMPYFSRKPHQEVLTAL